MVLLAISRLLPIGCIRRAGGAGSEGAAIGVRATRRRVSGSRARPARVSRSFVGLGSLEGAREIQPVLEPGAVGDVTVLEAWLGLELIAAVRDELQALGPWRITEHHGAIGMFGTDLGASWSPQRV